MKKRRYSSRNGKILSWWKDFIVIVTGTTAYQREVQFTLLFLVDKTLTRNTDWPGFKTIFHKEMTAIKVASTEIMSTFEI